MLRACRAGSFGARCASQSPMREILVNVSPRETRAALIENGGTQEVYVERANRRGIVGNLYKGRVSRVLPGMQAAFIDIGLERTAFLHAGDIASERPQEEEGEGSPPPPEDIGRLVLPGQDLLVQVLKEPLGTKGARLSTLVSLPSRFLVYMPLGRGVGVSARIEDEQAREHVRQESLQAASASLVHADLPLGARMLRDELGPDVRCVLVDSAAEAARMRQFAAAFMPEAVERIEPYTGPRPLFELYGVEQEIARALDRKVQLKSGGYIVIDQTESMTTVDVNTGGYVGTRSAEDTVFRTNLEAASTIARQLRLRNLGGIIIIDFIDMLDAEHREQLLSALQEALAADRAQTQIAPGAPLGLVALTRKRTRESLGHLLCEPCPTCQGRGFVRSVETICHEICREALRQGAQAQVRELLILAHAEVVERLLDEEAPAIADLGQQLGKPVRLQSEALYSIEQFDVVLA